MPPAKPVEEKPAEYDDRNSGDRSGRFVWSPEDILFDEEMSSEAPTADMPTKPIEDVPDKVINLQTLQEPTVKIDVNMQPFADAVERLASVLLEKNTTKTAPRTVTIKHDDGTKSTITEE